jgi:pimeloyl-ACP methyl ester carboxylesterase
MRVHRVKVAALDRAGQLEVVVDRPTHERHEGLGRCTRSAEELGSDGVQSDEVIGRDCGAGVIERPCDVGELERLEAERPRELGAHLPRLGRLSRDCSPRAVQLLGASRARERLERVDREAPLVRVERRQRSGARHVCNPGPRCQATSDLRDRAVRNAKEDELAVFAQRDASLAEPSGDGRADAAGTDDVDCVEHQSSSSVADTGHWEGYTGTGTLACLVGRRLLLGLLFAAVLVLPGQARAATPFAPCGTNGVQCATVDVPLDRSGRVSGTLSLNVEMLPAAGQQRGVMFLVAGGPGQGSAGAYDLGNPESAAFMRAMIPGYTFVAVDNRGTGKSGLIRCPGLQAAETPTAEETAALAAACAAIIGTQREFYATRDHAEDIDAVRAALDVNKIALYGVSYGTKLSLAYALAHPSNVERLLLDSMVVPTFPDVFDRNVLQQMPGTLRAFCAGLCRAATPDFAGDVVALANRLQTRPISGKVIAPNGSLKTMRMNGEDLLTMMIDADLSPGLAASAPAAVRAARSGNVRPLLRLWDLDVRTRRLEAEDLSFGLNAATNCADGRFPWSPATPPAQRRALIDNAIAALLPGSLGPFGSWAARLGTAFYCEQWPSPAGNTPLGPGPLPNVPVFAVNGGFDVRTPTSNAFTVISQFPQGRLLVVPGVGHSVLTTDFSFCSQRAVRAWILGTLVAPTQAMCPRVAPVSKILGAFPRRPAKRTVPSTLAIAKKAVREAQATYLQLLFSPTSFAPRGLYGGKLVSARSGDGFTLTRYSIVPGVFVTGKFTFVDLGPPSTYRGTVRVTGPATLAGTLRFTARNAISGTLGGKRIKGTY